MCTMSRRSLPDTMALSTVDLSQISLFVATREQASEARRRTHVEWSKGLSMEAYLQHDQRLEQLEHARDGRLFDWVLAPRIDPRTLDFYCACETYKRPGIVLDPTQGEPRDVTSYGIASVFTPAQNRRRGYAQHMMRLLHWVMSHKAFRSSRPFPTAWGTPPTIPDGLGDGVFSVLYSDVGPKFYAECGESDAPGTGWQVSELMTSTIPVSASASTNDAAEWQTLDPLQCEATWKEDVGLMKKDVQRLAWGRVGQPIIATLPTHGVAGEQLFRTMDPTTGELPSEKWGLRLEGQSTSPPTFATWAWEFQATPKSMVVTRLRASDVGHFERLLRQLVDAAAGAGVEQVEIWNVPEEFRQSVTMAGGKTLKCQDHLPSIKYYGGTTNDERVHFAFNEKFAWC